MKFPIPKISPVCRKKIVGHPINIWRNVRFVTLLDEIIQTLVDMKVDWSMNWAQKKIMKKEAMRQLLDVSFKKSISRLKCENRCQNLDVG